MPRIDFRTPRLFVSAPLAEGVTVPLERDGANYLLNVLRLAAGSRILVFNGVHGEWAAEVRETGRRTASLAIVAETRGQPAPSRITYAFAPLKHARLDYMVQKAVEMGVGALQPVWTRRTQSTRLNGERMAANVVEAAEQCGVLAVPALRPEMQLDAWLADWPAEAPLVFCDEDAEVGDALAALDGARGRPGPVALLIGPEGGFDEAERRALLERPAVLRLSLGPRVLRADTAAVAALALVQATLGDWR